MQPTKNPKKILVLASGDGSTFEAIVHFSRTPQSHFRVVGLVSNRKNAFVLSRAETLQVSSRHISLSADRPEEFFQQVSQWSKTLHVDGIVLAGFLPLVRDPLLSQFPERILNTHPGPLPKYGGKGMFGDHVHEAVLSARESTSAVSVHVVNARFDEGKILAEAPVPVQPEDTVESLSKRVREVERQFYPKVINQTAISW